MWMYNLPDWKVKVIYNGVNVHDFDGLIPDPGAIRPNYGIGPMDLMVLFSGRMTYQKGPDLLVEAIPMILRYHSRTKFVFAGDGDLRGIVSKGPGRLASSTPAAFSGIAAERNSTISTRSAMWPVFPATTNLLALRFWKPGARESRWLLLIKV